MNRDILKYKSIKNLVLYGQSLKVLRQSALGVRRRAGLRRLKRLRPLGRAVADCVITDPLLIHTQGCCDCSRKQGPSGGRAGG